MEVSELTQGQFTKEVQTLSPRQFEEFVADIWRARGWNATVTNKGPDKGIDVIATKTEPFQRKEVIQVKRYSSNNPVGGPQIQQYASLRQQENADTVVVVTSGQFTEQAQNLAQRLNVKLVDSDSLSNIVRSEGLDDLLSEYLSRDSLEVGSRSDSRSGPLIAEQVNQPTPLDVPEGLIKNAIIYGPSCSAVLIGLLAGLPLSGLLGGGMWAVLVWASFRYGDPEKGEEYIQKWRKL